MLAALRFFLWNFNKILLFLRKKKVWFINVAIVVDARIEKIN